MLEVSIASYENIHDNLFTSLVRIDLKKAFDTVFYPILLSKPENCGIRGIICNLLSSYLKNRLQFASFYKPNSIRSLKNSNWSSARIFSRSFIFLININNLTNALNCKTNLFADDT